jgi:phage terminase large subunit GpA-like protein
LSALAELELEWCAGVEPPLPPRDGMTFMRSLFMPSGELEGMPFDPKLHMGQWYFLQAFFSGRYQNFVLKADTQVGKSWLLQAILFYCTCELGLDVLYGLPDMRFAADVWTKKIRPALIASGLGDHMPQVGSGSGGGTEIDTVHLKNAGSINFHGSHARRGGGGNDGRTIPVIINDEADSLSEEIINKNNARADAFFRIARRLMASTVKTDDFSVIVAGIDNSTGTVLAPRCPSCKRWSELVADNFTYDADTDYSAEASARIACSLCKYKMDERERQMALRESRELHRGQTLDIDGNMVGSSPTSSTYGLALNCWVNPFKSLGWIAKRHRGAKIKFDKGQSRDMIDLYHDHFSTQMPRSKSEEELDQLRLAQRSAASGYQRGVVPARAVFLTGAVDQQKRDLVWLVRAHDLDGRTWVIEWGNEVICDARNEPTPAQRTDALTKLATLLGKGYPVQDSQNIMQPVIVGLDVAAWPSLVAGWIRDRPTWQALHGAGAELARIMQRGNGATKATLNGWYELRTQSAHGGDWDIMWLDSDEIKHEVGRAFARPIGSSASAMLPGGLSAEDSLIRQMCAEKWQKNRETGKMGWIKIHKYNEAFDLLYYTQALGQYWQIQNPGYLQPVSRIRQRPERQVPNNDFTSNLGAW